MASLYLRNKKFYLRYWNPDKQPVPGWDAKPTPFYYPQDKRKAEQLKAATTAAELAVKGEKPKTSHAWNSWVPSYLKSRYATVQKTYARYSNSWTHLASFLDEQRLVTPSMWRTEHNAAYVDWKIKQGRSRNVAIWDLGVLAMLMNEAKRRGIVDVIRASKARIPREHTPEKPALTDAHIATIRTALVRRPDLATAFEIALHTGCRLSETVIDFKHINFERGNHGAITFMEPKGGPDADFTVPIIWPSFRKWLLALKAQRLAAGHSTTCDLTTAASRDFGRVCDKLGLKEITFHCLRVTFVTRAFESGMGGETVRKLVNHSDVIVNRLYQRFSLEGLQELGSQLNLPVVKSPRVQRNAR
jgi:integrase